MRSPRFAVGDKVIHRAYDKVGSVLEVFHDGEQPRYYVRHSHQVWSVPESALLFSSSGNQVLTESKNERRA